MSTGIAQLPVGVNGKKSTADVPRGTIALRGIRPADIPLLWKWLMEFPCSNFDDYGPKTEEEFHAHIVRRLNQRELCIAVLQNDTLIGCIGYRPMTDRLGTLHGICFSKEVHGTGAAPFAVHKFLETLFAGKVERVMASYFQDNLRIKKFLRKQGFVHEGTLMDHTLRGGRVTNMAIVGLLKKNFEGLVN